MVTKTAEKKATETYVDQSIDAQRQYIEGLFGQAAKRVEAVVKVEIEQQLKTALTTIRPDKPVLEPSDLGRRNIDALAELSQAMATAAARYERSTSFRVKHVVFDRNGTFLNPRVVVSNT